MNGKRETQNDMSTRTTTIRGAERNRDIVVKVSLTIPTLTEERKEED